MTCPFIIYREKNVEKFIIYESQPHHSSTLSIAAELATHSRTSTQREAERGRRRLQPAKIESADRKRKRPSSSTTSASADPAAAKSGSLRDKHRAKAKMSSPAAGAGSQVRASHILIKHEGSRRKASWKDPEGRVIRSTTRESAVSQLNAFREDIVAGKAKFEDLASRFSDCSSAKRGGDLGPFGRGQMQKPFEEATYALKVGEISEIIDTDSGVHIIMRTG